MKTKSILIISIVVMCLGLTSCGTTQSSGSTNLVCASIESYLSSKALALVEAAQGGSAVDSVNGTIGGHREVIKDDATSIALFDSYLSAMTTWAVAVDQYRIDQQSASLTEAATKLESQIDSFIPKCESRGWRFESGWRG
ncbi:hypothetical protein MCETARE7_00130 [Candidatus Nanopelagicaceae bacterium]